MRGPPVILAGHAIIAGVARGKFQAACCAVRERPQAAGELRRLRRACRVVIKAAVDRQRCDFGLFQDAIRVRINAGELASDGQVRLIVTANPFFVDAEALPCEFLLRRRHRGGVRQCSNGCQQGAADKLEDHGFLCLVKVMPGSRPRLL